jgi:hypothetical protein
LEFHVVDCGDEGDEEEALRAPPLAFGLPLEGGERKSLVVVTLGHDAAMCAYASPSLHKQPMQPKNKR